MPNLGQLSPDLRRNVMIASEDKNVQRLIVEAMWDCMQRGDTGIGDITEYIESDDITDPRVNVALWGEKGDEDADGEEEGDPTAVCNDFDAMEVLINEVKDKVLQALKR